VTAEVNIPAGARAAFVQQTTEYIELYETHDARVWAESASEVAADLARAADQYARLVVAAELARQAKEFEGNARACKNLGSTEHAYGRAEGLTIAKERLLARAAELRGESR
jgi:hypothetical protein